MNNFTIFTQEVVILFSCLVWAQSRDCAFFMPINKFLSLVYLHLRRFNK